MLQPPLYGRKQYGQEWYVLNQVKMISVHTLTGCAVNVSDALRNLVMDHAPNSDTFQRHYLNRHISLDLWAIHRSTKPQKQLIEQATSHGHSRSSRRPVNLTPEQSGQAKARSKLKSDKLFDVIAGLRDGKCYSTACQTMPIHQPYRELHKCNQRRNLKTQRIL